MTAHFPALFRRKNSMDGWKTQFFLNPSQLDMAWTPSGVLEAVPEHLDPETGPCICHITLYSSLENGTLVELLPPVLSAGEGAIAAAIYYYLPLTTDYVLLTTYYVLRTPDYLLLTTYYLLLTTYYLLLTTYY